MPAGEDKHSRTEPPTPKRKKKARDEGRVARSPEVYGWLAVLVGTFLLPWLFGRAESRVLGTVGESLHVVADPTTAGATAALFNAAHTFVSIIAPIGAIFTVLAIVTSIAQTGRAFSFKAAKPKLARISPKGGLKRVFGAQAGVNLLKQLLKLLILAAASYQVIHSLITTVTGGSPATLAPILGVTVHSIISIVRIIALIGMIIGLGDYAYHRHKLFTSLKMTKWEVKEESKAAEGNPEVKAEIRKRGLLIARGRLKAAIRQADVVVTNPTHYAVALQYTPGGGGAPKVVAKGSDNLAKLIRERAIAEEVPIVEDAPLARYLYAVCEIDQQIPAEIYVAVARLLAFVYSLPVALRASRVHQGLPSQLPAVLEALDALTGTRRRQAEAVLAGVAR